MCEHQQRQQQAMRQQLTASGLPPQNSLPQQPAAPYSSVNSDGGLTQDQQRCKLDWALMKTLLGGHEER